MQLSRESFKGPGMKRIVILLFFIALLFALKSILHLILITFILTYLVDRLHMCVHNRINKYVKVNYKVTVLCLYVVLLLLVVGGTYNYLPSIITQVNLLVKEVVNVYKNGMSFSYPNETVGNIMDGLRKLDLTSYLGKGFDFLIKSITDLSHWGTRFFIAFVLSLFFLLEKKQVKEFTVNFRSSKIASFYSELEYFGHKFLYSFGKVIEVQFLIALINCLLTTLFLWVMDFPHLFGLAIMIFLLGLIPVMGVVISLIPLCAIAISIGGVMKVVYVLIMISVVHAIEAYILSPKLMSSKIHLPIFYTFSILIVFEHFLGVWGLLLGLPLFMFVLDLLEVDVKIGKKY